jgi:predicted nucleotidyltransferase
MQPTAEQLHELVQRIVSAVRPLRVILFGSAARGEMSADSDLDVLVIMPDGTHRRHTTERLQRQFLGLSYGIDVVVATPADLTKYAHSTGLIYRTILEEGRELYAA